MNKAGWKHYKCNECGIEWSENTRDYESSSIGCCIDCISEDINIIGRHSDDSLKTDKSGNLYKPMYIVLGFGKEGKQ